MPREAPYLAVADALRARILAGEWEIGDRLPSRAQLAAEYAATPWTGVGHAAACPTPTAVFQLCCAKP